MSFLKNITSCIIILLLGQTVYSQPEYRVKSIVFDANTSAGFQAGKPITVTYQYENIGNATGTNIQIFAYVQIAELGLRQDVVFDAQAIGSFPAGQVATVSYTFTSNTAAVHKFGGAINKAIKVGKISLTIPSKPEQNTNNNIRVEPISIFCEGSILSLSNLQITDERPIVAEEIRITASGIKNGAKVVAQADTKIVLRNGFRAEEGSSLRAITGDCANVAGKLAVKAPKGQNPKSMILADGIVRMTEAEYQGIALLDVKVYPNPSDRFLQLSSANGDLAVKKLSLYNNAKIIKQQQYKQPTYLNDLTFTLDGISSGMYLLEITLTNGNIITKKIIKQ